MLDQNIKKIKKLLKKLWVYDNRKNMNLTKPYWFSYDPARRMLLVSHTPTGQNITTVPWDDVAWYDLHEALEEVHTVNRHPLFINEQFRTTVVNNEPSEVTFDLNKFTKKE